MEEFVVFAILLVAYILPTAIAVARKKKSIVVISAINIFAGWTVVGWTISLVLAMLIDNDRSQDVVFNRRKRCLPYSVRKM